MSISGAKTKGYYARELAILENKTAEFKRSKKKGIKKQNK
jgi:hypothetical protein